MIIRCRLVHGYKYVAPGWACVKTLGHKTGITVLLIV